MPPRRQRGEGGKKEGPLFRKFHTFAFTFLPFLRPAAGPTRAGGEGGREGDVGGRRGGRRDLFLAVSPPPLSPRGPPSLPLPKKKFFPLSSPLALFSLPSPSLVQSVLIAIWHLPLSPPRPSPSSPTPKVIANKARGGSAAPGEELANHIAFLRRNEWQKKCYMQAKKSFIMAGARWGFLPPSPQRSRRWVAFGYPSLSLFLPYPFSLPTCDRGSDAPPSLCFLIRQNGPQSSIQQTPIKTETKRSCCFAVCTVRRSDNFEAHLYKGHFLQEFSLLLFPRLSLFPPPLLLRTIKGERGEGRRKKMKRREKRASGGIGTGNFLPLLPPPSPRRSKRSS